MAGQEDSATTNRPASFLSLPGELRNGIYELILLHHEPIDPWNRYDRRKFSPGLLRTNKMVHGEASPLFYGQNRFSFVRTTSQEVASFLGRIGARNASYIRHLLIDFPAFLSLSPGDITLKDDSIGILATIWDGCSNLSTLRTSLDSTNLTEVILDSLDDFTVAEEALKLVAAHFGAISSLQEIILEVYEEGPSSYIRRGMESHGWKISTTENEEEEDWSGDLDDFDDHYAPYAYDDDDDSYHDDYDIDNDSDFWRRAAD